MAKFVKGDVVVVPFPFSDFIQSKRRPALVVATLTGDDIILCQITSKTIKDHYAVSLNDQDFASGSLQQPGNIRPNRLFTAERNIILYPVGTLNNSKMIEVTEKLIEILKS